MSPSHFRFFRRSAAALLLVLAGAGAFAQTIYAVGGESSNNQTRDRLFTVNPANGALTIVGGDLLAETSAAAASPVNGLIYYLSRTNPAVLYTRNPATGANATVGNTALGNDIIRATFCPDGRLYASASDNEFYELNATTGATLRTITATGLPTGGSGDFACASTGDLYFVAPRANSNARYAVFRVNAANLLAPATTVAVTRVSPNTTAAIGRAGTPTGLAETPAVAGCPAPCFWTWATDDNGDYEMWRVRGDNGEVTGGTVANTRFITDLARSYPLDVSIAKSVTPTAVLQGQTVTYTLVISNDGPGIGQNVTVTDVLSPTDYASASWTCSVVDAGAAAVVPTACNAASGTGSVNTTVSVTPGGSVRFIIAAVLNSAFTGTLSNVGRATVTALLTETDTGNNTSTTSTATVTPAANISVTKTDNTTTVAAGQTTSYTITVTNNGPANAPGTVVRDPAVPGLNCTSVNFASAPAGGASVPPGLSVSALQGAGASITPTFNVGAIATFTLTCGVTATGQ